MYKKILVPLDNSELSQKILPQVVDLASCMNSEVILLTVGYSDDMAIVSEIGVNVVDFRQIREHNRKTSQQRLSGLAEELAAKGVKASVLYREGNPAIEIIQAANDAGCDLIAMATHGRGEIAWVLGSVAEKVVSHANLPVLLLRVLEAQKPSAKTDSPTTDPKIWESL